MSLLDDFARPCVLLDKSRVRTASGYITTWAEGAEFYNYQALDTSMEARRAEKEGVTSVYSVLVQQSVPIEYNDFFRDKTTGETYRVTSEPMARKPHARPASISSISRQKRRRYRHDKGQALQEWFSQFLTAYSASSVPDDAVFRGSRMSLLRARGTAEKSGLR